MIILDTNVLSEPMRETPSATVLSWLDRQDSDFVFVTVITLAKLLAGTAVLAPGKRRTALEDKIAEYIRTFGETGLLPFDATAARHYAACFARAHSLGVMLSFSDGQIAGIAAARNFAIATRDTAPFHAAGIRTINPWEPTP